MSALGAKSCLQKHHFSTPGDIAITCISGTTLCMLVHPSVTTVEQPVELMAQTATELIIERLENPAATNQKVMLDAEMIIQDSSFS